MVKPKAHDPDAHAADHLVAAQGDGKEAMQQAQQPANGDGDQETKQVTARRLRGDEAQRGAKEHHALNTHVDNARALPDQFSQAGDQEIWLRRRDF